MARGRMLNTTICADKLVNQLSNDTSRLGFTWLIAHLDREGRTYGDPAMVRSLVFPRRIDITVEQMEGYITEWAELGLIVRYEAEGDLYISFPKFDKNQPGLRKDREPVSTIPPMPETSDGSLPDNIRINDGRLPDECPVKRREEKRREEKGAAHPPATAAMRVWEQVTGMAAIPFKEREAVEDAINGLSLHYPREPDLIAYLGIYYTAWIRRRSRNGRTYSKLNAAWLGWALAGEIPEECAATVPKGRIVKDEYGNEVEL